ncbi:MAG: ABC transporter, partial [Desulfurococcales archaeon]
MLAGDNSGYPLGETTIAIVNKILEGIGSNLALDYVSVEDPVSNAAAPYKVVAIVKPSDRLSFLGFGAERV